MTWFQAFRGDFGYSHYGESRTSVTADIPFAAIIYTCILISIAALVAAAGIRGRQRWYTLIRLVYSLAVGSIVLVSLFGYCWQLGEVRVHAPYIYRNDGNMEGTLGVRVGLQTINITLQGTFYNSDFSYNEEYLLGDVLYHAPNLWKALDRGLPQPLLAVIDNLHVDEGGLRFGRSVWFAGYFCNILLWTAFAFWVAGNILLCSVVWYGAACFTLTGVCMVTASVVYHELTPRVDMRMHCAESNLRFTYGWCFWSVLVFGILTTLVGLALFLLDHTSSEKLSEFFVLDPGFDDQDDYKQVSSMADPSDSQSSTLRLIREKRSGTPKLATNWYTNYGYESSSPRSNPVFQAADPSYSSGSMKRKEGETESGRPRSFSDIAEEDSGTTVKPGASDQDGGTRGQGDPDQVLRRLSEIYIDVEQ